MNQETRTRKKYAPQVALRPVSAGADPTKLLAQMQAVLDQVARLQRASKRMSRRPHVQAVPTQAADQAQEMDPMTQGDWEDDQQRRKIVLAGLIAKAQALVPDPPDSPTREACRESPLDEIIVAKFRRQGFNL